MTIKDIVSRWSDSECLVAFREIKKKAYLASVFSSKVYFVEGVDELLIKALERASDNGITLPEIGRMKNLSKLSREDIVYEMNTLVEDGKCHGIKNLREGMKGMTRFAWRIK